MARGPDPAHVTILCGPPAVTEIYTRNNSTSEDLNFFALSPILTVENRASEDVNRGGSKKEEWMWRMHYPLAIFKHVFDEYKFFIISNFFENKPYALSTHNRKCTNKMPPSYLVNTQN